MKLPAALACSLAATLPVLAIPTTATLTLVVQEGFNEIELTFTPPALPEGSDTTTLGGMVTVELEIDPETDQVSEMTITDGTLVGTAVQLEGSTPFVGSYDLTSSELGAVLTTPLPPGIVDPPTGDFDASQHSFTVTSGTLGGNISIPLLGVNETIDFDFNTAPVGGAGDSTGNVSLSPTGSTPTSKSYEVTVLLPIAVNETVDAMGFMIPITAIGTAKMVGPATVDTTPANPYTTWAEGNGIPGEPFGEDENSDGVPNGLQWALGLDASTVPFPFLLQPVGDTGATVDFSVELPAGGSAADLTVVVSDDPENTPFTALASGSVSAGNPIPAGTSGEVLISLPKAVQGFVQLSAAMP